MSFILFIISLGAVGFWQGAAAMIMTERFPDAIKRKWDKVLQWVSLSSLGLGIIWLFIVKQFDSANIFHIVFYICCLCIVALLVKNIYNKRDLFNDALTSIEGWNIALVYIPIQYMFVFVWVNLLLLAV